MDSCATILAALLFAFALFMLLRGALR